MCTSNKTKIDPIEICRGMGSINMLGMQHTRIQTMQARVPTGGQSMVEL